MTDLPKLSSKNDDLRYKLPPEIALIRLEIKPEASGASKITGTCAVLTRLHPKRLAVRSPAMRPTNSAASKSSA